MQLGLFTPVFNQYSLDKMLAELKHYPQITALEIGTGCWPGNSHVDLDVCLNDAGAAQAWKSKLDDAGLSVSAFSCHGNAIHPDYAVAKHDDEIFRKTVLL
ncbi:MAG TPA: hypothetical protein VK638_20975, partial [Edaphobacter sp.]|nr:hypothetical protein [Edaphobacter sp.]